MVVAEYERKGAKEEVQDPQQDGRQDAEAQALHQNRQFTNQNPTKRKRPTIGSKKRSWNGRMHDHSTVLAIDLSIFSIGAIHSGLPVSFRSRIAFRRRRTGWYVSGTKRTIRQSYEASISLWYTWCAAQSYLNSRPDDEDIETPDCILTNRRFARKS
jgi:hypothetical protein